jgi:hypothetical protein
MTNETTVGHLVGGKTNYIPLGTKEEAEAMVRWYRRRGFTAWIRGDKRYAKLDLA